MKYPDGSERSGRWVDGELVEPKAIMPVSASSKNAAIPAKLAPDSSGDPVPPPAPEPAVDLPAGLAAPRTEATATERFVYRLAVIARHYCLDITYRPKIADDELDDAHWTVQRSADVASLLQSPLAADVPATLRDFCAESQRLDGALQAIAKFAFDSANRGRDEALRILLDQIFGGSSDEETPRDSVVKGFGDILKLSGNIHDWLQAREIMLQNFAQYKRSHAFHNRWAALLFKLAEDDPGLRPYAAHPEASDPTWHYLRNRLAGDVFPGLAAALSRTGVSPNTSLTPVTCDLGDIRRSAVRVRLPKHGLSFYNLSMTGTSYGMVFAGQCNRGHFGFFNNSLVSAWVGRGLVDGKTHGRLEFPGEDSGRGMHVQIKLMHLPTTSRNGDEEVDGSLLIYLRQQYHSEAAAATAARTVNL